MSVHDWDPLFGEVFDASEDAILILDGNTFIDCNEAAVRMLRCDSRDELLPAPPWGLSPERQPDGRLSTEKAEEMIRRAHERHFHRFEWVHTRADGENFPVEVTLTPVNLEGRRLLHVVWRDITDEKEREAEIARLANYDPLTSLPNRRLLNDRGRQALALARRLDRPLAVMFVDLDRFKDINDTLGHDVGDALLAEIARPLGACLRESDTLARLGGDEFALLLPEAEARDIHRIAERVLAVFRRTFDIDGRSIRIGASIGIVVYPGDGEDLNELIKNADIAMYQAKSRGGGYVFYQSEHGARVNRRVEIESELKRALDQDRLQLHFQPRVDVTTGEIRSLEALLRWYHPEQGWISPAEFIPVAERTGQIHAVGVRVLEMALGQLRRWRDAGIETRVGINVSAHELDADDFVDRIREALTRYELPAESLEVEITETAAMSGAERGMERLSDLRALGVEVAIDDFGTGYSSLSYLKRCPVDTLKIDQSFIRDMIEDPTDASIIDTIIQFAHTLGITRVVAEGVEYREQEEALKVLGCTEMQGFFYCRPAAAEIIEPMLASGYLSLDKAAD